MPHSKRLHHQAEAILSAIDSALALSFWKFVAGASAITVAALFPTVTSWAAFKGLLGLMLLDLFSKLIGLSRNKHRITSGGLFITVHKFVGYVIAVVAVYCVTLIVPIGKTEHDHLLVGIIVYTASVEVKSVAENLAAAGFPGLKYVISRLESILKKGLPDEQTDANTNIHDSADGKLHDSTVQGEEPRTGGKSTDSSGE